MMLRHLRITALLVAAFFGLAPTLSGAPPWMAEHVVISSTTDWVVYTAPSWARACLVKNEGSGTAYLGRYDETSTFDSTNDEYITLPAGTSVTIPITAGQSTAPSAHLAIPIASATASLPVGFYCTSSSL
jgi:hypothetical protein